MTGSIRWSGHVQWLTCNAKGLSMQREPIAAELRQRSREVRQSPDGWLYGQTDGDTGTLLSLEPAS